MSAEQPIEESQPSLKIIFRADEVRRLTLFKWRYSLESAGFTTKQAEYLIFMKWLYARGRLNEDGHLPGFRLTKRYLDIPLDKR